MVREQQQIQPDHIPTLNTFSAQRCKKIFFLVQKLWLPWRQKEYTWIYKLRHISVPWLKIIHLYILRRHISRCSLLCLEYKFFWKAYVSPEHTHISNLPPILSFKILLASIFQQKIIIIISWMFRYFLQWRDMAATTG